MKKILLTFVLSLLCQPSIAKSQNFSAPELTNEITPRYPRAQLRKNKNNPILTDSGIVDVLFMVSKEGKPYEIIVLNSSHPRFEQEAIEAISDARFRPATLDGQEIESKAEQRIKFVFSALNSGNPRGGHTKAYVKLTRGLPDGYSHYYDQFSAEMAKGTPSKKKAQKLLNKIASVNHHGFYSLAYLSLAEYQYAKRFESPEEQIEPLRKLIAFDSNVIEKDKILVGSMLETVHSQLIRLQIEMGYFSEALKNYENFSSESSLVNSAFAAPIQKIRTIKSDNVSVTERKVLIGENGYAHLPLFKRSFMIDNVDGNISNLKLRCDTRFSNLKYQAEGQYDIPDSWGSCYLQVLGKKGTTAVLLQQ